MDACPPRSPTHKGDLKMTTLATLTEQGRWTDTHKRTAEETYDDVKKLIYHTVWGVVRKHGGDFDDFLSEANEVFLTAYADFDGSCPFSNWLRQCIVYQLLDCVRNRCQENSRFKPVQGCRSSVNGIPITTRMNSENTQMASDMPERQIDNVPDVRSTWRISELLEELGDDARTVVKLVVETPAELAAVVQEKGDQPRNYRSSVRNYLAELGWTAVRVAESFNEIRHALSE
jgi:RNA polymerase sigma factor (sigma-70 family)